MFAGTPLDGARITGRLAGVIDTYGSMVVDAYRENEEFYDRANAAVAAAWDQRALTLAVREQDEDAADDDAAGDDAAGDDAADDAGVPAVAATDEPTDDEPADDAPADGEPTDGEPTGDQPADALVPTPTPAPTPTSTPSPTPTVGPEPVEPVDPVVMVLVSDLHCNVGMARIIRTVAERSDADIVLNAGDTTVNGTSVEQYCVTSFSQAVPPGVARVVADGNHDSLETEDQERAAGWTVLDGEVVTVEGLRILGDRDPNRTQIGGGTTPVSEETPAEAGARLAGTACEGDDVDLLLIHTPRVGDAAMRTGCVAVQLSGHQHRRTGPLQVGQGIRYVSSTTAGATSGGATVGPLNGVADITVLRWDPDRGRMVDLQVVQVMPDGSATVGPREPFPQPQPVGDDGEVIEDDGQPGDEVPGDQAPGDEVPGDEATDDGVTGVPGVPGIPGIPGTDVTTPGTGEPTPAPTPTPASLARRTEPVAR
ncbi:metallophosphoesterase [Cellulomonas sp. ATA003]|uniref:metallophosphoesterase family protein n=1 Tax=Cellulomonas sp. ATA003 TaxID=3073064 RepID=UPI0028731095|nr:metallophosphoesterase [Cellulomonas sp. ATA003]WNB84621.1 metallophosphoesterase [Cellulomonas sp. ATA003]